MSSAALHPELEKWYKEAIVEQAEKASSQKKILFRSIKAYIGILAGFFSLILIVYLIIFIFGGEIDKYTGPLLLIFSVILSFTTIAYLTYGLCISKINSFPVLRKAGVISPFKSIEKTPIYAQLTELCIIMNIDFSQLRIWKVISQQAYPSVEEDDSGIVHLVLPPNFFLLAQQEPSKSKAILAHELGHVLQADSKLFLITETYLSIINKIFIPLIVVGIAFRFYLILFSNMSNELAGNEWFYLGFLFDVVVISFLVDGFNKITQARKQSEFLADTAALLYTGNKSIVDILKNLKDREKNSIHPDKQARLDHINKIISDHNFQV
jgi:hypothetical protein